MFVDTWKYLCDMKVKRAQLHCAAYKNSTDHLKIMAVLGGGSLSAEIYDVSSDTVNKYLPARQKSFYTLTP